MSPHRVLVTGASGFIGGACAREFLSQGWQVTAMSHRRPAEGLGGARIVAGSLSDARGLASVLADCGPFDAVVNCAGLASDVARPRRLMEANHVGAANLAQAMAAQAAGRLVHISTTDVYGIRDFVDADETTPLEDNLHQAYPHSKILAERSIAQVLPPDRYVFLRPGAVCGPGDKTILPRVLGFLRHSPWVVHFGPWKGGNRWPLAHVRNVARAALLAATCDEALGQAYNVVDPQATTVEEYYRWVLRTFLPRKAAIRSVTIPMPVARVYARTSTILSRAMGLTQPLMEPSIYALWSIASNLDLSSRKLQTLFASHGQAFASSFDMGQ